MSIYLTKKVVPPSWCYNQLWHKIRRIYLSPEYDAYLWRNGVGRILKQRSWTKRHSNGHQVYFRSMYGSWYVVVAGWRYNQVKSSTPYSRLSRLFAQVHLAYPSSHKCTKTWTFYDQTFSRYLIGKGSWPFRLQKAHGITINRGYIGWPQGNLVGHMDGLKWSRSFGKWMIIGGRLQNQCLLVYVSSG